MLVWINAKCAAALVLIWEILPSVVNTINFLLAFSGYALLVLGSSFPLLEVQVLKYWRHLLLAL